MSGRVLNLKQRKRPARNVADASVRLGKLMGLAAPNGVYVELEPGAEPVAARLCIDWDAERLAQAVEQRRAAVLAFEDGDVTRPLVIGVVTPVQPAAREDFVVEADADGRRVRLQAQEQIVLQCGDSSITLKRDGRVVIRGSYVETYASGTNRIKGGNVRIN